MTAPLDISRVTRDGRVERLGQWLGNERVLELEREGFPFLGPGRHQLEGELPWIFWDMCPSGYLGRQIQARMPGLKLSANPRDWGAAECLRALTLAGGDLAGNLLIGEQAIADFNRGDEDTDLDRAFVQALRDSMLAEAPSSLGGERPKIVWTGPTGAFLTKFAPPSGTPQGDRWSDLLRAEALAARALRESGVLAVDSEPQRIHDRTFLDIRRFDRLPGRGRVGAATLYWLAMDRYGDVSLKAPEVMRRLHAEGLLDAAAVDTVTRVHAFSAAIGNDDAHPGNYGLVFDDGGRASLAPIYDVLPMIFAPRNDELPDAWLSPRATPVDPAVTSWVEHFAALLEADQRITREFKTRWRTWAGR